MKRLIIFLFPLLFLFSCEEMMPVIPCLSCDMTTEPPIPQDRKVFVEEFTGVRCVNCPQGSAEIENLLSVHGEKLIAVSIHAGSFSTPYSTSQYDFRTSEGTSLLSFVNHDGGFPSSVINRYLFNGEADLILGQASWAGFIAEALTTDAAVTVTVENTYDESNRNLKVNVSGNALSNIDGDVRISVMITESNIVDLQLNPAPDGLVEGYKHKHVLRTMLTAFDGDFLANSMSTNEAYDETFNFTLPEADSTGPWNPENISVIAFLHRAGDSKEVLQVGEAHLVE